MKSRVGNPMRGASSASEYERIDSLLFYVSSWVTNAGAQRMQNFYFFLAFQGALAAFLGAQFNKQGTTVSLIAIGCLGVVSSLAFAVLEIRNTELILSGKEALEAIGAWLGEASDRSSGPTESFRHVIKSMPHIMDNDRRCLRRAIWEFAGHKGSDFCGPVSGLARFIVRHAFVYRIVITLSLIAWGIFIYYAITAYHPV